jgi:predicted TIM-barrel fold metal-dependent hydrolase
VLRVVELFGAERCAWGAHFPLERYSPRLTYGEHLRIYREELPLGEAQRRAVLGETARRLWFPDLEADEDGRAL